jgi:hypothetical protein
MNSARSNIIAIFVAASLVMIPAFTLGHITGHSSFLNVTWSEGFAERLFAGDFYPRWLPEMSRGAGSPVFYFYAPFPFYLTAPFHLVFDARLAVVVGSWAMLALSGISFFLLARSSVLPAPALVAALLYMVMPYHLLVDVWIRAALGEQAAFIFMPLCLLCAFRLGEGWGWTMGLAGSHAGLLYSHIPSALLFAPVLAGVCLWVAWHANTVQVLARSAVAAALSSGLAAAYIVPAVVLQDMIHAEYWGLYTPERNFLFSSDKAGPVRAFLEMVLIGAALTTATAFSLLMFGGKAKPTVPWIAMAVAVLFIVTPMSSWLWSLSPALDRIQFPWRAISILELATCMIFALVLDARPWGWRIAAGLVVVLLIAFTSVFTIGRGVTGPVLAFLSPRPTADENAWIAERADAIEYLPACRPFTGDDEVYGASSALIVERVLSQAEGNSLAVFYYPFLTVVVAGHDLQIRCDPMTGLVSTEDKVTLPFDVSTRNLPAEVAGYGISALSLVGLMLGLFRLQIGRR